MPQAASSRRSTRTTARRPAPADVVWVVAVPVAAVTLLAVVALGPTVGQLLPSDQTRLWNSLFTRPEPTEQARFLLALVAPLLLVGATAAVVRRAAWIDAATAHSLARAIEAAAVAVALGCLIAQQTLSYDTLDGSSGELVRERFFTPATIGFAFVATVAFVFAVRDERAWGRLVAYAHDTRARSVAASLVAFAAVVVWLLHAVDFETTTATASYPVTYHLQFTLDETFAVLNGRSPLVDFVAQYGALWPYPVAGVMALVGPGVGAFTILMCSITGMSMLALFDLLRRVARSALVGLLLFLPLLATTFFLLRGPLDARNTFANVFGTYPLRFAGPWLLAWLTARHLDGARPRTAWPLFLAAGLVTLNNTDHGFPAFAATIAALAVTSAAPRRAALGRLTRAIGIGLAAALALVSLLTLLRAGSLPHLDLLFRFAEAFVQTGYGMLPMPAFGLHTAIFLTFVAAIGTATARAIGHEEDRLLTGMLAWVGVFGLGAGAYFAGRSHPEVLVALFGPWSLAIALLAIAAMRRIASSPARIARPAELLCLFGLFLAVCSLAQTPAPWTQIERLSAKAPKVYARPPGTDFVAAHTRPGEHAAILLLVGHKIGYELGVTNVAPYTASDSMPEVDQLDETIRALRAAGGRKVFLAAEGPFPEIALALERNGFDRAARTREHLMYVDRQPRKSP